MTKPIIIADSSPLISLSIIGELGLLPRLYQRVVIPNAVWDEVVVQGVGLPGAEPVSRCEWLEVETPPGEMLASLSILVDRGEAEALALAQVMAGSTVLLDDAQARRRVAERFQIPRIGTLGILRRAKKAGFIREIKPLILSLRNNGIFIRQALMDAVLQDAGEAC